MSRLKVWFAGHYPLTDWWIRKMWNSRYDRGWQRYLKRHRECCEYHTSHHCAEYLEINPKKAVCWGYVPETCPECGRKIPKRILYKWMKIARFVEHYEEAKEKYKKS